MASGISASATTTPAMRSPRTLKNHVWRSESHEVALAVGNAAEAILKHAEEWNPDLIVMGTRGRRGLANFLSGSATEWLVRHAKLPVLVVHDVPLDAETVCQLPPQ